MRFFLRILISLLLLAFIFVNVYVASLPSDTSVNHTVALKNASTQQLLEEISSFNNWKNLNASPTVAIKVNLDRFEPLNNIMTVDFEKSGDKFSVQNQLLNDTLVVQHVYGLSGSKATVMQWIVKKDKLHLDIKQEIGTKQKLKNLLGFKDAKTELLKNNYSQLIPTAKLNLEKVAPIHIKKQVQNPKNIIHLPKQN